MKTRRPDKASGKPAAAMTRNPKVSRRIAAGKLTLRIRDLRNLGPRTETMLAKVGIHSVATLRRIGGVDAYWRLRKANVTRSLNALWALVGALEPWPEGRHWRQCRLAMSGSG